MSYRTPLLQDHLIRLSLQGRAGTTEMSYRIRLFIVYDL